MVVWYCAGVDVSMHAGADVSVFVDADGHKGPRPAVDKGLVRKKYKQRIGERMMKNILRVYDKTAEWLCKWGSDKYVHLLAGLLVGYLWLCVLLAVRGDGMRITYAWYGVVAAGGVALIKELIDDMRGGRIDPLDIVFTMTGGLLGSVLFLIG